jgi:hypothetical protein
MHARKNQRTATILLEQISGFSGDNVSHLTSGRPEINLGTTQRQLIVSMESFFDFNFELSKQLEIMVEEKLLSENQKEWDELFRDKLRDSPQTCQPLISKSLDCRSPIPRPPK